MKRFAKVITFLTLLLPIAIEAAEVYSEMPEQIRPNERYVIYSHGLIVEGDDPTPVSPEFGTYDFPEIKAALFEDGNFNLIAHQRPENTEILPYVDKLEAWVLQLIDAGVKPSRISLVGFSRGGQLTALASSRLENSGINTAIMAICSNGDFRPEEQLSFGGHVLSIYETTDVVTSCSRLLARSVNAKSTLEVAISTGKKHGAFFQPLPAWVMPLKDWINATNR